MHDEDRRAARRPPAVLPERILADPGFRALGRRALPGGRLRREQSDEERRERPPRPPT
ncbi:MAG TPA: hypothetical protein VG148_12185 [Pyrinomonadaceae bacterium]|nr:hypothetical protein [Pyrinomonadaceae bacterium]